MFITNYFKVSSMIPHLVQRRDPHEPKLFQVKLNTKLLSLFIFFSIFIQGNANTFDLSFETLSVDRIPYSSKYKILESVDPVFKIVYIKHMNLNSLCLVSCDIPSLELVATLKFLYYSRDQLSLVNINHTYPFSLYFSHAICRLVDSL